MIRKNLFKSLTAYLCLITVIAFTSCNNDDDNTVPPVADNVEFTNVSLSTVQEGSQVTTNSSGTLNATYDKNSNKLAYTITYSGLTPMDMHIHKGFVGEEGSAVLTIPKPYTSGMTGTVTLTDESLESDLLAGNLYLNVHTTLHAGGEIRGQIVTSNFAVLSNIALSGKEQVPMIASTSTGLFNGLYDKTTKKIKYSIMLNGFTQNGMHIHTGAVGTTGINIVTITGLTGTTTQELTSEQETDLLAGNLYFNAHSADFGNGEVRGQLVTDNKVIFSNEINAANVPSESTGSGSFYGSYDKTTKILTYLITYSEEVIPTAMHFHIGAAGTNGTNVADVAEPYSNGMTGSVTLNSAMTEADLLAGLLYLNIHSTAFGDGEIRAQLVK